MLELGKAASAGSEKGVIPVLRDGEVVATLRAANWREAATAVIGDRAWVYAKSKGVLTARWADEPEDSARLSAQQSSFWKGTWTVHLDSRTVEVESSSWWRGTHRFVSGGTTVASSGNTGGWAPRLTLDAADDVPLHQQVFLLWLELVISRRNNATVTAATTAAVIGGSS